MNSSLMKSNDYTAQTKTTYTSIFAPQPTAFAADISPSVHREWRL